MEARKTAMRVGSICLKVAIIVMVVLGIVYAGRITYHYAYAVFSDAAYEEGNGTLMKVTIPEGVSSKRLARVLEEQGLVEDSDILEIQMKLQNFGNTVKAGTYELSASMKPSEMLDILSGKIEEDVQ